jgi:hypothetical protein
VLLVLNYGRILSVSHLSRNTYKRGNPTCFIAKNGKNMTEEPTKNESPIPEKLLVDEPTNFPFHAAYLVYSELFDVTTEAEAKADLNRNIEALKENRIDCETFYRNIAHYRKISPSQHQERFSLQTQRKRDWRMKTQRQERIRRHKK